MGKYPAHPIVTVMFASAVLPYLITFISLLAIHCSLLQFAVSCGLFATFAMYGWLLTHYLLLTQWCFPFLNDLICEELTYKEGPRHMTAAVPGLKVYKHLGQGSRRLSSRGQLQPCGMKPSCRSAHVIHFTVNYS